MRNINIFKKKNVKSLSKTRLYNISISKLIQFFIYTINILHNVPLVLIYTQAYIPYNIILIINSISFNVVK